MELLELILGLAVLMLGGLLWGLIPFFLGRYMGKPGLGKLGLLCCMLSGMLGLSLPVLIGFVIAIFVKRTDFIWPQRNVSANVYDDRRTYRGGHVQNGPVVQQGTSLNLTCLSGPLRGQTYPVGANGLMIGRDPACAVCVPEGTPGVSSRHCCIRWQQGVPVLVDLNSSYGTFMGDGRKLPPQYPVLLAAGSRFYLANTGCMFQMTLQ